MRKKQQGTVAWSTSTVGDASRPRGTTDVRERVPRPERINRLVNLVLCKRGEAGGMACVWLGAGQAHVLVCMCKVPDTVCESGATGGWGTVQLKGGQPNQQRATPTGRIKGQRR